MVAVGHGLGEGFLGGSQLRREVGVVWFVAGNEGARQAQHEGQGAGDEGDRF